MTDVFTRLARRALGEAEVLSPQLPARFETAAPVKDTAQSIVDPPRSTPSPSREAPASPPCPAEAPQPSYPDPTSARPTGAEVVPPRHETHLAKPHRDTDERLRPSTPLDTVREMRPATESESRRGRSEADAPHRIRPLPPPPVAALPPRRAQAPTAPAAQSKPAVHISIGRIEVRAVPPPPAPAAPAAAPPATGLSLADYLRGDDGRPR